MPSVADTIAQSVAAAGIDTAFGHPGGEVVLLIDAFRRAGVEFILTHHENTAAFMASGQGEMTGVPGICIATLGPGATNMVTGAASALLERAPVLLFTGALAQGAPEGTTHQALDLNALYAPVTKRSLAITPENASDAIYAAITLSTTAPQGPIHLSIPADVAASPSAPTSQGASREASGALPNDAARDHELLLAQARNLLAASARPAIIVGLTALREGAADQIRKLAHATGAIVATLPKAKGVFPEDDPNFVGTLEMVGDDIVVEVLNDADVVVAAGVDSVEFDRPWRLTAPVIHVDVDSGEPTYWRAHIQLMGDLQKNLVALTPDRPATGWKDHDIRAHRASLDGFVQTRGASLQTWEIVRALRSVLGRGAIAACDVGAHKLVVGQAWPTYEPRTFFMANGLSSMGYSIPVAAAARRIRPDRPVVAFVGDGGLAMYLGELETLARLKLDLTVVVFVDGSLELIRRSQMRQHVPFVGTSFNNPDFEALGRAFGIGTYHANSTTELESVLPKVAAANGIRLLVAEIDRADYRL